jgi:hypothetical protein
MRGTTGVPSTDCAKCDHLIFWHEPVLDLERARAGVTSYLRGGCEGAPGGYVPGVADPVPPVVCDCPGYVMPPEMAEQEPAWAADQAAFIERNTE